MNHAREPLFFEAIQIRRPPTQELKICADPGANILCSRNTINCLSSMSWGNLHEQLSFHFVCQEQDGRRASVQKRNCFFLILTEITCIMDFGRDLFCWEHGMMLSKLTDIHMDYPKLAWFIRFSALDEFPSDPSISIHCTFMV